MKRIKYLAAAIIATLAFTSTPLSAAEKESKIGIVNFSQCVAESKLGKAEQESVENVKNQITSLIKDIEQQLTDLSTKFNDADYLDGLSPEGEQELKAKFQTLKEEHSRYQAQFYQVMQQANMKLYQTVSSYVNLATKKIADSKKLSLVINKDACFSFDNSFDITALVIDEMDRSFESQSKEAKQTTESK